MFPFLVKLLQQAATGHKMKRLKLLPRYHNQPMSRITLLLEDSKFLD